VVDLVRGKALLRMLVGALEAAVNMDRHSFYSRGAEPKTPVARLVKRIVDAYSREAVGPDEWRDEDFERFMSVFGRVLVFVVDHDSFYGSRLQEVIEWLRSLPDDDPDIRFARSVHARRID